MPKFKPFKGIRPVNEIAGLFSTQSVDAFTEDALKTEMKNNKNSFLQIIKPTWENLDLPTEERFQKIRHTFDETLKNGNITQDRSSFYIYQIIKPNGESSKGLIGLVNIDDYLNNKIKKHEETLSKRVELFANYLNGVNLHAEPVLLTYTSNQRIDLLIDLEMKRTPTLNFKDKQENEHSLWTVRDRLNLQQFKKSIEKMDALYIADGHHRMESSAAYTQNVRSSKDEAHEDEDFNYTMAMLISDQELIIHDFNRIIKDLNGLSKDELLAKLAISFDINERDETPFFPTKKHHIVMYLEGVFYSLFVKKHLLQNKGLCSLDTHLFEEHILKPIFNITNSRDDDRISFVKGTSNVDGVIALKEKVDSGKFSVSFSFYPVVARDLQSIADLGLKMPPKSTYIEPKPLSGLTIFDLLD